MGIDTYVVTPTSQMSRGGIDTDGVVILNPSNTKDNTINIKGFEDWWNLYDYKVGRKKAEQKWKHLPIALHSEITEHTKNYVAVTPDTAFRKHPATYLNGEHWNDQIQTPDSEIEWEKSLKEKYDTH